MGGGGHFWRYMQYSHIFIFSGIFGGHQERPANQTTWKIWNVKLQIEQTEGVRCGQSHKSPSEFTDLKTAPETSPNYYFFSPTLYCHVIPASLSHDGAVAPTSDQALFSPGTIHAHTCVPLAVAMTTPSAWSAAYSQSDTWVTTSPMSERHPSE